MATFKQMIRKEQLLVIPITFWSGIEQGFFDAEFTAVSRNKPSVYKNPQIRDL